MLVERSEVTVKEGAEEAFAAAMKDRGIALLASVPGVTEIKIGRGVENPGKFILLVTWDKMDSHKAFPDLPVYPEFRAVMAPFVTGGAMEHFEID